MDNLDLFITNIVNKKISTPYKYQNAIRTAMKTKNKLRIKIIKTLSAACTGIILTTGIAFASYVTYEKIWKEPWNYNLSEEKPSEISKTEKENILSEDEISQKAQNILKKLGYTDKKIRRIDLNRSYADNSNSYYSVLTENEYVDSNNHKNIGININFNAETGQFIYFLNNDFYSEFENQLKEISEEEAIKIAKETINYVGYNLYDYKIDFCEKNNIYNEYVISFSKNYNEETNKYNNFRISLGKVENKTVVHSIVITIDDSFDNNEYIISKEDAMNIAKNKEQEFSNEEITNINAKKSIEKMNTFIYCLENNIANQNSIAVENKIRNVWTVKIEHNKKKQNVNSDLSSLDYYKKYEDKIYYVDATTGEIIGGEQTALYLE